MQITPLEQERIQSAVRRAESKTGAQIVLALTPKSDSYPEIPWKAFSFAAAAGALDVGLSVQLGFSFFSTPFSVAMGILLPAAAAALACSFLKPFARLFLNHNRAEQETLQYAKALFLDHGLQETRGRHGVLICVSLFERQVTVLPDNGIGAKVAQSAWQSVVDSMSELLADGRTIDAMEAGVARLESALLAQGLSGKSGQANELPDVPIQGRGE